MSQAVKDWIEQDAEDLCQQFAEQEIDHDEFYRRMAKLGFTKDQASRMASNFDPQF